MNTSSSSKNPVFMRYSEFRNYLGRNKNKKEKIGGVFTTKKKI